MKTNNIRIFTLIAIAIITSLLTFSFTTPNEKIIGIWVSEKDSDNKWEFTTNNKCYQYYEGEETDIYSYNILTTSPQCGYQVKTGGSEDFYLRLTNTQGDEYCYEILGISDDVLSLNYLGTGGYMVFNKQ